MEPPSEPNQATGIENLHIPDGALNPWHDEQNNDDKLVTVAPPHVLHTPDPSVLDESVVGGLEKEVESEPTINPQPLQEVLSEFDPLAHQEEKEAREAWENSEAHPPARRTPSPAPGPSTKDPAVESPPPTAASSSMATSKPISQRAMALSARPMT